MVLTLDIDTAKKKTFRTASSEGCTFSTLEEIAPKIYNFLPFFCAITVIVFVAVVHKLMLKRTSPPNFPVR